MGKVETSAFLRALLNGSDTAGRQDVGRVTVRGVVEGFRNGEDLKT